MEGLVEGKDPWELFLRPHYNPGSSFLQKIILAQLTKVFAAFHGTREFIDIATVVIFFVLA